MLFQPSYTQRSRADEETETTEIRRRSNNMRHGHVDIPAVSGACRSMEEEMILCTTPGFEPACLRTSYTRGDEALRSLSSLELSGRSFWHSESLNVM
ncbi:hypothetical protein PHLCEN_2v8923 [Hermanssonia centrifuga]|uniref:Uncharacterized protein n=1 Tax=Hermanssonia centrifuga TaxID=98765 RepID=A0A2R6NS90_9APHY|nr:hypothetical protein PHLCEN_2v8923 [Hermanssonia centrifuga]